MSAICCTEWVESKRFHAEGCATRQLTPYAPYKAVVVNLAAEAARDEAIRNVERGAPAAWLAAASALIKAFPAGTHFTTDDLWAKLTSPPEPRAMGAVVKHASMTGLITSTGRYLKSARAECHARPVAVWERL